ncbi:Imm1 family immunity protein [Amycolatopsis sp. WAC 01416]|uniref:Imm1 family immunity protein n=1 Tax=Amycolatopsis sp. WAC 01416 TaxID=2203196 RepID=UPI001315A542|nr:Imm1 family immunity protein [Amycolatopsis sp. WAC 01416]
MYVFVSLRSHTSIDDDLVEQARRELPPPVTRGRGVKTHGRWFAPGKNTAAVTSGRDDRTDRVNEIVKEAGCPFVPLTAAADVELKIAAEMRDTGITDATVVINNVPCQGQASCDDLLGVVLPDGQHVDGSRDGRVHEGVSGRQAVVTFDGWFDPGQREPLAVSTSAEVDELLDRMVAEAESPEVEVGLVAQLDRRDENGWSILQFGVRAADTMCGFVGYASKGETSVISTSGATSPEPVAYDYQSHEREVPSNAEISWSSVRQVVHDYVSSAGARPARVTWLEVG